ncbi:hypothetical protein UFOVP450_194 [uncultured Caudovirales phage]|uniref:Uncharacterized protein n=1 Tax=uncultured Caudovirales phage TaxID=2100421 RepID=A0A6J5MF35_9CAUD|nr:hypothetical protein UFOVP450_194 [uncultured Caudovirales phage]
MAFITNLTKQAKPIETKVDDSLRLSLQEIEFLLQTLKSTTIVGDQVEMFYIMVMKLQEQYIQLQQEVTK